MRHMIIAGLFAMFAPFAAAETIVGKLDFRFPYIANSTVTDPTFESTILLDVIIEPGARYVELRGVLHAGNFDDEVTERRANPKHGVPIHGSCSGLRLNGSVVDTNQNPYVICHLSLYAVQTNRGIFGVGLQMTWYPEDRDGVRPNKLGPRSYIAIQWPSHNFSGQTGTSSAWHLEDGNVLPRAGDIIIRDTLGIFSP